MHTVVVRLQDLLICLDPFIHPFEQARLRKLLAETLWHVYQMLRTASSLVSPHIHLT
jgi:hypothetical protein